MRDEEYEQIFITDLPSFYKIRLYNEIIKYQKIFVIFTYKNETSRNNDFLNYTKNFDYAFLSEGNVLKKTISLFSILKNKKYKQLVIGGWNTIIDWIVAFISPKNKNAIVIESTCYDSSVKGIKGLIKKIFLSRISTAYVSGGLHKKLLQLLSFDRKIIITKGVGLYNLVPQPSYHPKDKITNFLYVGRLIEVKNLEYLIKVFNSLPELRLTIIGFGEKEKELKEIASENIHFVGAVKNTDLPKYYKENDVFVLPSLSETWGLVIEEALNNGLPCIISDRVGCQNDILKDEINGLIFKLKEKDSLKNAILKMCNTQFYNNLAKNISEQNPCEIEQHQVSSYKI